MKALKTLVTSDAVHLAVPSRIKPRRSTTSSRASAASNSPSTASGPCWWPVCFSWRGSSATSAATGPGPTAPFFSPNGRPMIPTSTITPITERMMAVARRRALRTTTTIKWARCVPVPGTAAWGMGAEKYSGPTPFRCACWIGSRWWRGIRCTTWCWPVSRERCARASRRTDCRARDLRPRRTPVCLSTCADRFRRLLPPSKWVGEHNHIT